MRLTLHIGSHKAGSTAIQRMAGLSERELANAGVIYPRDVFPNYPDQHSELARLTRPEAAAALDQALSHITARAAGYKHVFLSGEDLCSTVNPTGARLLSERLARSFSQINIVLVLRNKRDYLVSHFNHFLRHNRNPAGIDEFLRGIAFDPLKTKAIWGDAFGSERIKIVPFDTPPHAPDLLTRFYTELFDIVPTPEAMARCKRVNPSFDILTTVLINEVLKRQPGFDLGKVNQLYSRARGLHGVDFHYLERDIGAMLMVMSGNNEDGWPPAPACTDKDTPPPTAEAVEAYLGSLSEFAAALAGEKVGDR